jgi:transcriptional regulator with XRE-family HTH domain
MFPCAIYLTTTGLLVKLGSMASRLPYRPFQIGTTIRREREKSGITQVQLAKALRRSQEWVSRVETGDCAVNADILPTIAEVLGCSVQCLFTLTTARAARAA